MEASGPAKIKLTHYRISGETLPRWTEKPHWGYFSVTHVPTNRSHRILRRPAMALAAALVAAPLVSIADSLSTRHERCPDCNYRLTTTGPYGEPLLTVYNVKCGWCGYHVSRYPDEAQ